jgi:hypothetical protein
MMRRQQAQPLRGHVVNVASVQGKEGFEVDEIARWSCFCVPTTARSRPERCSTCPEGARRIDCNPVGESLLARECAILV